MKLKLLRDARIRHHAGEVVEVSPEEYAFLTSTHSAEPVLAAAPKKAKKEKKEEE